MPIEKLIITIVKKGEATKIVEAAKKAGASGGTTMYGKGTAERRIYEAILGVSYEVEKEIIFIVVDEEKEEKVLKAITKQGRLNKPGNGVSIVLKVNNCIGMVHLLKTISKGEEE